MTRLADQRSALNYCRSGSIYFLRISRGEQIRKFKKLAKVIIKIELLYKNENSRILSLVKSPKIRNSRKLEHAKIIGSTFFIESN